MSTIEIVGTLVLGICLCVVGLGMAIYARRFRDWNSRRLSKRRDVLADIQKDLMTAKWYSLNLRIGGIWAFLFGILSIVLGTLAISHRSQPIRRTIVEKVSLTDAADEVPPPPPNLKRFSSMEDWLFDVCISWKPEKPVQYFDIGIFESAEGGTLYLVGRSRTGNYDKIVFEPRNMYFQLPRDHGKNLTGEQLDDELVAELRDFTQGKTFGKSYLAEADSILFQGKTMIWSK